MAENTSQTNSPLEISPTLGISREQSTSISPNPTYGLDKTNLDVENPLPEGGPKNFPEYNHIQKYSPNNTYLDSRQDKREPKSDFGINNTEIEPQNIFKNHTSLDLEHSFPNGGPNRNNAGAGNITSGVYQTTTTTGVLKDLNGNVVNNTLHQYSPNNKYIN
tara:strand:- start:14266 stop:14751 length:486 start_codon:yes stop_codon:yes gene_type:complete